MDAQGCLAILRKIKDVAFATVDESGKPQVRIIDVMIVEDGKLYFCTGRGKDFYRQLENNPQVAVTGLNPQFQMVRLTGKAKKLADQKTWIDRIFEENPSMKDVYPGESRYILEPFCIDSGELEFFDLGTSPIYRESFCWGEGAAQASETSTGQVSAAGSVKVSQKAEASDGSPDEGAAVRVGEEAGPARHGSLVGRGFQITDACIGCGKCLRGCPQQCITKGKPYRIQQEHCLHCGLCFENCPVKAIVRRGE